MKVRSVWLMVGALALVAVGFLVSQAAVASAPEPGSPEDPLVSKSYVDQFVALQVVTVARGERLIGEGGTEIILRAGDATVVASESGGVSNLTAGKDLKQGEKAAANNLLLIPRPDGRGLQAVTDVIVLVRGPYTIVNPAQQNQGTSPGRK